MKITWKTQPSYAEEGQPNPLRWAILSGSLEEGFTNETSWLKCKDFFNDYCYTYNTGKPMAIYGFNTKDMAIPAKGEPVYIAVKDITPQFKENVQNVTSNVAIHEADDGTCVLELHPDHFANTYSISLVSLVIRLCNVEHSFGSLEEMKVYQKFPSQDQSKWNQVVAKKVFFSLPEKLKKYIWYSGEQHNSETEVTMASYQLASNIHNCGVLTYGRFM